MELGRPVRSQVIRNSSDSRICGRCSQPLSFSGRALDDLCGRCREASGGTIVPSMQALPETKFVPTVADLLGKDPVPENYGKGSSRVPAMRSNPYPNINGPTPSIPAHWHVPSSAYSAGFPEIQGIWVPVPVTDASSSMKEIKPLRHHQPGIAVSQSTTRRVPPNPTPHFNAKGELIKAPVHKAQGGLRPHQVAKPPFPQVHTVPSNAEVRLCARYGCGVPIPSSDATIFCPQCRGHLNEPFEPRQDSLPVYHPRPAPPSSSVELFPALEPRKHSDFDPSAVPQAVPQAVPPPPRKDGTNGLYDLELQYPETEEKSGDINPPQPPQTTLGSTSSNPIVVEAEPQPILAGKPLPTRQSGSKATVRGKGSSRSQPIQRPAFKEARHAPGLLRSSPATLGRECATQDCKTILPAETNVSRCVACIKKDWRSRLQPQVELKGSPQPHKRRKTVTWGDMLEAGGNAAEDEDEGRMDVDTTAATSQSPTKLKIRLPALRISRSAPPPPTSEPSPATASAISPESALLSSERTGGEDTPPTSASSSTSPKSLPSSSSVVLSPPLSVNPSPSTVDGQSVNEATSGVTAADSSVVNTSYQPISGWDSDLTDLSDLSDLEESGAEDSDAESIAQERPSFKIRIPARPSSASSSSSIVPQTDEKICTISHCRQPLPVGYRWKCCVQCRLQRRHYQRKRLGILGKDKPPGDEVERDFAVKGSPDMTLVAKPLPDYLTPGARLCTIKRCTRIIPAPEEYPYKMCEPCRVRTRNNAKARRMRALGVNTENAGVEGDSGSESDDEPLTTSSTSKRASAGGLRRCKRTDCGLFINPQSIDVLCGQCRARKSRSGLTSPSPLELPKIIKRVPAPNKIIPPYPEYVCWSKLLDVFHTRVVSFLEALRFYERFKKSKTISAAQTPQVSTFKFEGEYSVVAVDFEVQEKKSEVLRQTMQLKDEIGRVADLAFLTTYWVTILQEEKGIATRFKCKLRTLQSVNMTGELEIAILPDHTHLFFPGRRTVVRFCLVG